MLFRQQLLLTLCVESGSWTLQDACMGFSKAVQPSGAGRAARQRRPARPPYEAGSLVCMDGWGYTRVAGQHWKGWVGMGAQKA